MVSLLLLPIAALVLALTVAVRVFLRAARPLTLGRALCETPRLAALARTDRWLRWGSIAVGSALGVLLAAALPLGRGLALAPVVLGTVLVAGILLSQLIHKRAAVTAGAGTLERRTLSQYLSAPLIALTAFALTLLAAVLVLGTALASPDDFGLYRTVTLIMRDGSASAGPFPGSYYSVPVAICAVLMLACAVAAARVVVNRPRATHDVRERILDDQVRRRSLDGVASAMIGAAGAQAMALATFAAIALRHIGSVAPGVDTAGSVPTNLSWVALGAAVVGAALMVLGFARFLVPAEPHRSVMRELQATQETQDVQDAQEVQEALDVQA